MKDKNPFETLDNYMEDVYSQLECNTTAEYQSKYVTFTYTPETIEKYRDSWFAECYNNHISAYLALTQLSYYIKDHNNE